MKQRRVAWMQSLVRQIRLNRIVHTTAAEATPKLINRKTIKALVQCAASKDVSDFTDNELDCWRCLCALSLLKFLYPTCLFRSNGNGTRWFLWPQYLHIVSPSNYAQPL
jgi:hypothetical protein